MVQAAVTGRHIPLSYGWAQTGGPAVTLSNAAAVNPTFTAPGPPTILTFTSGHRCLWAGCLSRDEVVVTLHDVPSAASP
jgi:hypothetical protein